MDLNGSRIGLLGLGKIGSRMSAIAKGFGMEVCAWSQNLTSADAAIHGASLAPSLDALLADSDFVSIHLVLGERTRGLIGRDQLMRMKPTAYLINTARAAIVDRAALIEALREGWIAGAGLDVFETEPLPLDDELRSLPNLLATPHLGHVTRSSYSVYYQDIIEDLSAYLAGAPIRVLAGPAAIEAAV
jgi:phosphoglycerate dehydrogenase-like enzyme